MNNNFIRLLIAAILACSCNAIANTFWKWHFIKQPLKINSLFDALHLALTPNIIVGIFFYIGSMLLFFFMISNYKLSLIVPLTSLTYILNLFVAYGIFHEKIYFQNIIGTLIVLIGIIILSQTPVGFTE